MSLPLGGSLERGLKDSVGVKGQRVVDRVHRYLREAILGGELPPGSAIDEEAVRRKMSASKTPVREALQRLEHEGLVVILPWRGTYVRTVSFKDVQELFQLREAIELQAARLAVNRVTTQDIERIGARLVGLRGHEPLDADECHRVGEDLHKLIFGAAGNRLLIDIRERCESQIDRVCRSAIRSPGNARRFLEEHLRVIEALGKGSVPDVEGAMRAHLESVRLAALTW